MRTVADAGKAHAAAIAAASRTIDTRIDFSLPRATQLKISLRVLYGISKRMQSPSTLILNYAELLWLGAGDGVRLPMSNSFPGSIAEVMKRPSPERGARPRPLHFEAPKGPAVRCAGWPEKH